MGSWSQTIQQDLRTALENTSGIVATPESILALPSGIAIGDIGSGAVPTFNIKGAEFTPQVAASLAGIVESKDSTIDKIIELTSGTIAGLFGQQGETVTGLLSLQKAQGETLSQVQSQGLQLAGLNKYLPFIVIGVIGIYFLRSK